MKFLNKLKCFFVFLLSIVLVFGCGKKGKKEESNLTEENAGFEILDATYTGINFINNLQQTEEQNVFDDIYYFNGSGVAVGDINNDNLPDVFFGANQTSCKLYINKGDFKFEDVTAKAGLNTKGWATGVAMVDINNDGWLDIYVSRTSPYVEDENRKNLLFINNKNGTFTEAAGAYGLDNKGFSTHASFFDADNDGDIDMYLANRPLQYNGIYKENYEKFRFKDELGTHRMFLNNGNNKFEDVSEKSGVLCNGFGLSANLADINMDGLTDIYVCNDFIYPDFMYFNKGNGIFEDVAKTKIKHTSLSSMGSDLADINNDGLIDIFTVDMLAETNERKKINMNEDDYDKYQHIYGNGYGHQLMRNNLQLNVAGKQFVDIAFMAGVAETDWSWAPLFADFDNDGNKDLFVSNGYFKDYNNLDFIKFRGENSVSNDGKQSSILNLLAIMPETKLQNYVFKNNGDLTFTKKSDQWGIVNKTYTQGAAYADFDNDGDLDLVLNNLGEHPTIYKNKQKGNNYLKINFKGKESNSFGIGCKVWVNVNGVRQYYEHYTTRGFQSTVAPGVHIGLGTSAVADEVMIWWPSGKTQKIDKIKANTTFLADETNASKTSFEFPKPQNEQNKIVVETAIAGLNIVHKESDFSDFRSEPLLPHMLSRFGPTLAVADVNKDGLDDILIGGGARVQTSVLMIQKANGSFLASPTQPWSKNINCEHVASAFFDKDGDGDLDLILVSGGNEFHEMGEHYQTDIYENDGKGNYSLAINALPQIKTPCLSVAVADIDGDNDLDIFIGGAVVPRAYPEPTGSFLLINNGKGIFTDKTAQWNKALIAPGIVNEAVFADMNNDNRPDLIITGYWMNISVYFNTGNTFEDQTDKIGLNKSAGWWNALRIADIDGDGDKDIIAGNEGLNNLMRVSPEKPAFLVRGDMNKNNMLDAFCFYTLNGIQVPLHSYDEARQQLPDLIQKKYPKVAMYAAATKDNMFTSDQLVNSIQYNLYEFSSGVFVNNNGKFEFKPFPKEAQVSNINDILVSDLNMDGRPDLILVGNSDAPRISLGRNDASNGLVLINEKGNFVPYGFEKTGFYAPYNAQRIAFVKTQNSYFWLVANNSYKLQTFQINSKQL